jgi:hypothetical protein
MFANLTRDANRPTITPAEGTINPGVGTPGAGGGLGTPGLGTPGAGTPGGPLTGTQATITPTPIPQPTDSGMPGTGFFDDIGAGGATANNLPLFAVAMLGLVAVIVVARRLRVKPR